MSTFQILSLLASSATWITALAAFLSLRLVQKQQQAAHRPELTPTSQKIYARLAGDGGGSPLWRETEETEDANPDHAPRGGFLHIVAAGVRRRSVRLDRCEATRHATRLGLICLCRRLVGAYGPAAHGPDGIRPSATARNNARSGQLVGSWTRMRAMGSITRPPILMGR